MYAVRGDERLPGQLAGAVGRDGNERPMVLVRLELAEVAVDAAAGRVEDALAPDSRIASTTRLVSSVPSSKSMDGLGHRPGRCRGSTPDG